MKELTIVIGTIVLLGIGFVLGHTEAKWTQTCPGTKECVICGICEPVRPVIPCIQKICPSYPECDTNCEDYYNDGLDTGYDNGMKKGIIEGRKQCNTEFLQYN